MPSADRSRLLEEVLAAYLEAKERGEVPDVANLLRSHPQIADELKEFLANEKQFASAAVGLGNRSTSARSVGSRVGEYEIQGEIARGGMGVVYRARHVRLQRVVALKMMLGAEFAGSEGLRRFRTEAEVVASLDHPNIVPIYDVGEHDGHAYYAMKLIVGPSLRQHAKDYVGKPEEAARIIIAVARAVHHAHQRGVLHRDLKPGNVLLATVEPAKRPADRKKDKYPVAGIPRHAFYQPKTVTPFVADFGLAKRFSEDGLASHSTAVVGTAAYMAPEQATGKQALTVAADVYSLGAVLFELLTGRPPFVGQNQMEVLLQAIEKEPPSPLQFQPKLDPDLAQVCLKCLRKIPEDRYDSAEELAEELEHWLDGEPLAVRAPTTSERIGRWCRKHPWATLAGCVIALLTATLVVGSIGISVHLSELNDRLFEANRIADENKRSAEKKAETETTSRIDADKARLEAEQAKLELQATLAKEKAAREGESRALERRRQLLVQQYLANGQQMTQRGDGASAAIWYAAALEQDQGDADRELPHRIRLGAAMRQFPSLLQMWFLNARPRLVRLSHTGNHLVVLRKDGTASLWDARAGQRVGKDIAPDVNVVEFCPDGRFLAVAQNNGSVRLFETKTGLAAEKIIKHATIVHALAFNADGTTLATASADKSVRLWDVATGKSIGKPLVHAQEVRVVVFHPFGKKLITYAESVKNKKGDLSIWDLTTSRDVFLPWSATQGVLAAGFSRDGTRMFAVSTGHKLHLWQASGQPIAPTANIFVKGEHGQWLSPGADRLLQIIDNEVKVLDLPKGSPAMVLPHESPVYLAQYSPSGRIIITATANRGLRFWRASNGQLIGHVLLHPQLLTSVHMSHDDRWIATVCDDHTVRLWDMAQLEPESLAITPKNRGTLVSLSPNGAVALLGQAKGAVLWDTAKGKQVGSAIALPGPIVHSVWASDSHTLAIATRDETRLYDASSGKATSPSLKLDKADEVSFHLHYASTAKNVTLWNTTQVRAWDANGKILWSRKLTKQMHLLDCDGTRLALWRNKGTLEIQDGSSEKSRPLLKLTIVPERFHFSPAGQLGVAGFADGSLRIWDMSSGKPITAAFFHGASVRQIAWSPDARLLATADSAGRVRVWESATGLPLASATIVSGVAPRLAFSADGHSLMTWTSEGLAQKINLAPQIGDPADIARHVQLTVGHELHDLSGSLIPIESTRLQQLWRDARGQ